MLKFSESVTSIKPTPKAILLISAVINFCAVNNLDLTLINYKCAIERKDKVEIKTEAIFLQPENLDDKKMIDSVVDMLNFRFQNFAYATFRKNLIYLVLK